MPDLVMTHGLDDGATALVALRQSIEMTLQVTFDLPFGLGDETEAGPVTQHRRQGADAERTRHTTVD